MVTLSIYGLTKQLKERIQDKATENKWSLSQVVIDILEKYFKGK